VVTLVLGDVALPTVYATRNIEQCVEGA